MSIFQRIAVALRYVDALRSYAKNSNSFYQERKSVYWILSRLKQTFRKPGFPFSFKAIFDHPFIPIRSKLFTIKTEFMSLCDIEDVTNMFLAFPTWLTWLVFYIFWLAKNMGEKDMFKIVLTRMQQLIIVDYYSTIKFDRFRTGLPIPWRELPFRNSTLLNTKGIDRTQSGSPETELCPDLNPLAQEQALAQKLSMSVVKPPRITLEFQHILSIAVLAVIGQLLRNRRSSAILKLFLEGFIESSLENQSAILMYTTFSNICSEPPSAKMCNLPRQSKFYELSAKYLVSKFFEKRSGTSVITHEFVAWWAPPLAKMLLKVLKGKKIVFLSKKNKSLLAGWQLFISVGGAKFLDGAFISRKEIMNRVLHELTTKNGM